MNLLCHDDEAEDAPRHGFAAGAPAGREVAFTLIELLAVMVIITVVMGLVVPSLVSSLNGSQLSQASQAVVRQLDGARQTALSQNRTVEMRFYKYSDTSAAKYYQAFQAFLIKENGTYVPLGAVQKMPPAIMLTTATQLTSFIGATAGKNVTEITPASGDPTKPQNLPSGYSYFAFQFRPDGSTSLIQYSSVDTTNPKLWYFTLCNQNATGTPPTNYATIQVDPINGNIRMYRP